MRWIPVDEALPTKEPDWVDEEGQKWFQVTDRFLSYRYRRQGFYSTLFFQ